MEDKPIQNIEISQSGSSKKPRMIIIVVLVLILIGVGIFTVTRFLSSQDLSPEEEVEGEQTIEPEIEILPTDTPTPEPEEAATPTKKPSLSPSPRPTQNPIDKTSGLDRSKLTVDIKNGSGTAGVAGKMSDLLKNFGYSIGSVGNADSFDFTSVTIQVRSASSQYLSLLKKDISSEYTIGSSSADLSASTSADAVVIVGK